VENDQTFTLYTFQAKGHDLRTDYLPKLEYARQGEPYFDIAQYLGWPHWVWCVTRLEDLENDWMSFPDQDRLQQLALWILSVPANVIRWCALNAQCENKVPVGSWFSCRPESIRQGGDIPQALVRRPIMQQWVVSMNGSHN